MARMRTIGRDTWIKTCARCANDFTVKATSYADAIERLSKFFAQILRGNADGFCSYCRSCARDVNVGRRGMIHRDELLQAQEGKCAICNIEISFGKNAAVDHDHKTMATRKVLCAGCNNWMGGIDNDEWLAKALAYRDAHRD